LQSTNGNAIAPYANTNGAQVPPLSPNSSANAAATFNLDPSLLQTTIGSLLQSPAAAQMFLNSLSNSAQAQALQTANRNQPSSQPFPINQNQLPTTGTNNGTNGMEAIDPTFALFSPFPNQTALMQNSEALLKSYQDAHGIGSDAEKLQADIDSLVRSMGLDLPANGEQGGADPDFNVDEFLEHLAKGTSDEHGADGLSGDL